MCPPSTFFRYFPSKESLLLADDLDPLIFAAFEAQPPELSPTEAIRRAYTPTPWPVFPPSSWTSKNTRQRLMFSIPELKGRHVRRVLPHRQRRRRVDRPPNRPVPPTTSRSGCSPVR